MQYANIINRSHSLDLEIPISLLEEGAYAKGKVTSRSSPCHLFSVINRRYSIISMA